MQILTSVRNERSLHRSKRRNPTTRSWIPPRTFFAQVRFLRSGEKSPRPGSPAPPSGPENAGQKGQKSRPPGRISGRPYRPPGGPAATPAEAPPRRGGPGPPAGRKAAPKAGPETVRKHGKTQPRNPENAAENAAENNAAYPPRPARRTVSPARAEDPVQDLQPAAGARRRTLPQRRGPGQDPDAGGSHTPSRGREKKDAPASPRFADQLRDEESNSQQPAPPEGRSSESSDQ